MKRISAIIISICLFISMNISASPSDEMILGSTTPTTVTETVHHITKTLKQQKFKVLAVIDHQSNAANVGLTLRPTQLVLFRHPRSERYLTRQSRTVAIDLPFKILVYEDAKGAIKVKTNNIGYILDRHEIPLHPPRLQRLNESLDQLGGNENGLVFVKSQQPIDDTVSKLRSVLEAAGFFIAFELEMANGKHHSSGTLLIFGNPNVGTQLMQNSQETGLDLPQKYLVYKDQNDQVLIVYNDPRFIAKRAGIQGLDLLLTNISSALAKFANLGAIP